MILGKHNVVLNYHGIHNREKLNSIEAKLFRNSILENEYLKQLKTLKKIVKVVDESELFYKNFFFGKTTFFLTFDDGYRNNLKAAEIFFDLFGKVKLTVFLTTNLVGEKKRSIWTVNISLLILLGNFVKDTVSFENEKFSLTDSEKRLKCFDKIRIQLKKMPASERQSKYELILSQTLPGELERLMFEYPEFQLLELDEIKQMQAMGVNFEPHGHNHELLHSLQDIEVVKSEILDSKNYIEKNLNQKCRYFAYPNGDFCDSAVSILKENGFVGAYTTKVGTARKITNNFEIPRITPSINTLKFKKQIRGRFF